MVWSGIDTALAKPEFSSPAAFATTILPNGLKTKLANAAQLTGNVSVALNRELFDTVFAAWVHSCSDPFWGWTPWLAWLTPLCYWLGLALVLCLFFYSLNELVFKQWQENEKLIFPIAQLTTLQPAALVTRHINLVYSVALRQAGNPHAAEEITQAVFIILAKKAAPLRHDKALSSWLFQATRLTANNFVRSESRRHRREEEAYMQSVLDESGNREIWPQNRSAAGQRRRGPARERPPGHRAPVL